MYSVAFSPDGKLILTGAFDGTIRKWNLKGEVIQEFENNSDFFNYSVSISLDGEIILSGYSDGNTAYLFNMEGVVIKELEGHSDFIISIASRTSMPEFNRKNSGVIKRPTESSG